MVDCVPFLSKGSEEPINEKSCCSCFQPVLKAHAECICEALKSSAEMGIGTDIANAAILPSACGVSAPPISDCGRESPLQHQLSL